MSASGNGRQDVRIWQKASGDILVWFGDQPEPPPIPQPAPPQPQPALALPAPVPEPPPQPPPRVFRNACEEFDALFWKLTGLHPDDAEKSNDGWSYVNADVWFTGDSTRQQRLAQLVGIGGTRIDHGQHAECHGLWLRPPGLRQRRPRVTRTERAYDTACLMIEAALESGISATDAVRLGIATVKEVDVLARDANAEPLDQDAITAIRGYCRAILRSGTTFSAYEIATRAIMAYREASVELHALEKEWHKADVDERQRRLKVRQDAAAKGVQIEGSRNL